MDVTTRARLVAKFTVAATTPGVRPSWRSMRRAQAAQDIPVMFKSVVFSASSVSELGEITSAKEARDHLSHFIDELIL